MKIERSALVTRVGGKSSANEQLLSLSRTVACTPVKLKAMATLRVMEEGRLEPSNCCIDY